MRTFRQCAPALFDRINLHVEIEAGDSREYSYVLAERVRLASESIPDDNRRDLVNDLLNATHKNGGRRFSHVEIIRFLETPRMLFNGLETVPPPKRGPPSKKTIYLAHFERLKGFYNRLIRWPRSGGAARIEAGKPHQQMLLREVEKAAAAIPADTPERNITTLVSHEIERKGYTFDPKEIREILRSLGHIKGKNNPN